MTKSAFLVLTLLLALCPRGAIASEKPCKYPGDCLRHDGSRINETWGTCVSRSAWKQKFIHATPEERKRMRAERMTPMDDRILNAYRLDEDQRAQCDQVRQAFWEEHRQEMGKKTFNRAGGLRGSLAERLREHLDAGKRMRNGEAPPSKLPPVHSDPVLEGLRDELDDIDRQYPTDWSELADRIEDVLPAEQARAGRQRLAEQFPFDISARHGEKFEANKADSAAGTPLDRWEAYLARFVRRYDLTAAQLDAADSILAEVRARAADLDQSMRADVERNERAELEDEAHARKVVYTFDVADLFETYQDRLQALLTSAQREQPEQP